MSTEYAERVLTLFREYEPEEETNPAVIRGLMVAAMDRALREAAPAGEVTADADIEHLARVFTKAVDDFCVDPRNENRAVSTHELRIIGLQAALAAAFSALVQQVERLKIDVVAFTSCVNELSAANARLAKDAAYRDNERLKAGDATAVIVGDNIVIAVSIDGLANAVKFNEALAGFDDPSGHFNPPIVTDNLAWATAVVRELNSEKEDGTTRIHIMLDGAFVEAIEQGAEGILVHGDDAYAAAQAKQAEGGT